MLICTLGVDSPFFLTIVLSKNQLFPWVFDGFLKRRIPGYNGEGIPRYMVSPFDPLPDPRRDRGGAVGVQAGALGIPDAQI